MENYYIVKDATIFNGERFQEGSAIIIKDNKILDIVDNNSILSENIKVISAKGLIISPGFVDLQINGCGGVLFNDSISQETLKIMHETNIKFGCTSFLPTLITSSEDNMKQAVLVAKEYYQKHSYSVIGIHLEGPYISSTKRGAHNINYIKSIDESMVKFLIENVKEIPIKITLAPEENGLDLIAKLTDNGVHVSIGHSNASYEEVLEAIKNGASLSTHLFNAMSQLVGRSPGVVGAVLNNDNIYAGIIIDGKHVSYSNIHLTHKIKKSKVYMVTDAVTPMGTDMKEFILADQKVKVTENGCFNEEGNLAGANIDMMSSIKNAVMYANIPLIEALKMATIYPATAIGQSNEIGSIKSGGIANLAIFDSQTYTIKYTIDGGKLISY